MLFTGGYYFNRFEGQAVPVLREFSLGDELDSKNNNNSQATASHAIDRPTLLSAFRDSGCGFLVDTPAEDFGQVRDIIVNAVHNGPLDQAWTPILVGDTADFTNGAAALRALMPNASVTVAVNRRNAIFFKGLSLTPAVPVFTAADRYPQELPALLARDILHRPLTDDAGERDPSILVIDYDAVVQLAAALSQGRPCVERVVMVAGPGVSEPGWYRIRIGTPFSAIAEALFKAPEFGPWRIVRGDLFNGVAVDGDTASLLPTDTSICVIAEQTMRELFRFVTPGFTMDAYAKTTVAEVLALLPKRLDSGVHGGVRPCVQCNYCDEVCPVGIYPHIIWKHVEADTVEESFRFQPQECIGCRLCDYVCPSKIDLSSAIDSAKVARLTGEETS